ncbi:MAG TPA: hypothetical protein VKY56_04985 [Chloroflexota bacterium]|nr:hypothetical protein [Chloroflexota bacterium]
MNRHLLPLVIPITAIISALAVVFIISRILLFFWSSVSKEITPFVALAIAAAILVGATIVSRVVSSSESDDVSSEAPTQ